MSQSPSHKVWDVEMIELDPQGDIVLILKDAKLRVSSETLAHASPVFKAMLRPGFREGDLLRAGGTKPVSIELPEDDTQAITTICSILHQKANKVKISNAIQLEAIAMMADKYDFAEALSSWGEKCVTDLLKLKKGKAQDKRLLLPAYFFNDLDGFELVTQAMVYSHNDVGGAHTDNIVSTKIHDDVYMILPEWLFPTIRKKAYALKDLFQTKLDALLRPAISKATSRRTHKLKASVEECGCLKIHSFIEELRRQELRVNLRRSTVYKFSMNEILYKVRGAYKKSLGIYEEVSNADEESSSGDKKSVNTSGTNCKQCDHFFKEVDALLNSTPNAFTGLCSNCVKNWVKGIDRGCGRHDYYDYAWYGMFR